MKLQAEIGGKTVDIEIVRSERSVTATVDGRDYLLDVAGPDGGTCLIKHEDRVFEALISDGEVRIGGTSYAVRVVDPRRLRGSAALGESASGHSEIRTAMPGKVVRVMKAVGDTVEKGEGVIVVEAMKMQNELRSPNDGTITAVKFAEGDTVGAGDVLVVID